MKTKILEREIQTDSSCVYLLLNNKISPEFWGRILRSIPNSDVHEYGKESEPHVTLFYSSDIPKDLSISDIFKFFKRNLPLKLEIQDIGIFENNGYDVLYFKVFKTKELESIKDSFLRFFGVKPTYQDYIPHMTIAYLEAGSGEYYREKLMNTIDFPLELIANTLVYSITRKHTTYKHSFSKSQ